MSAPEKLSFPTVAQIVALVACPNCGAKVGRPCAWFWGVDQETAHGERAQEYDRYHAERRKLAEWGTRGKTRPASRKTKSKSGPSTP